MVLDQDPAMGSRYFEFGVSAGLLSDTYLPCCFQIDANCRQECETESRVHGASARKRGLEKWVGGYGGSTFTYKRILTGAKVHRTHFSFVDGWSCHISWNRNKSTSICVSRIPSWTKLENHGRVDQHWHISRCKTFNFRIVFVQWVAEVILPSISQRSPYGYLLFFGSFIGGPRHQLAVAYRNVRSTNISKRWSISQVCNIFNTESCRAKWCNLMM